MVRELDVPKKSISSNIAIYNYSQSDEIYKNGITKRIIKDHANNRYFEVDNDEMRYFGIKKDSLIIVDTKIEVKSGMLVACWVNTEFLVRKLCIKGSNYFLCVNNTMDGCINITGREIEICGAVTWTCLPHNIDSI